MEKDTNTNEYDEYFGFQDPEENTNYTNIIYTNINTDNDIDVFDKYLKEQRIRDYLNQERRISMKRFIEADARDTELVECPDCNGEGEVDGTECDNCCHRGFVPAPKEDPYSEWS